MDNAVSVILCHNHPSGSTDPSPQDMSITRVLAAACKIMQIAFLDHLIVSRSGYYSICRTNPEIFEATIKS
jgi:DNA repair protein RadC